MTHFGQHQQQHLLLRMLPGTSNPRASRRSRSLGVMTYLCRKGLGTVLSYPSLGLRPSGLFGLSLPLRFTATDSFFRSISDRPVPSCVILAMSVRTC